MMMTFPSAPGGATPDTTLPGVTAAPGLPADGQADATGLPALFAQLLDVAAAAVPGLDMAGLEGAAAPAGDAAVATAEGDSAAVDTSAAPLAAMLPMMNFAVLAAVRPDAAAPTVAGTPATGTAAVAGNGLAALDGAAGQVRNLSLLAATSDQARQAAANAITATLLPAGGRTQAPAVTPVQGDDANAAGNGRAALPAGTGTGAVTAAPVTAVAQEAGLASDTNGRGTNGRGDDSGQNPSSFRSVMSAAAPAADGSTAAATVKLAGNPDQWQQPLRAALGDRLQLQLQRNNDHAVIRLEPPNLGSIEISIRHTAGALQVNLSASNSDVLRQLNTVSDNMRQDLSQRQFSDVAVTVSSSTNRGLADGGGGRQQGEREQQERGPGRALSEDDTPSSTFAMLTERE
ncbi:flagellar hook-length control protein FliK [Pseudoduganella chitinolytica]|uniref:Flagellar hook-length control protein FliK n=1 Tax=Pseudoduganella chitinolytica TaxID=34070 RepID=A0ABY8BF83_9BURK|nr:flagellar hook-length control protein FliK [Pseudoduganella chitinolytica]WEF34058.1 flagellar hook-length control protein FliK [Pseudoduganella chitinolytica]